MILRISTIVPSTRTFERKCCNTCNAYKINAMWLSWQNRGQPPRAARVPFGVLLLSRELCWWILRQRESVTKVSEKAQWLLLSGWPKVLRRSPTLFLFALFAWKRNAMVMMIILIHHFIDYDWSFVDWAVFKYHKVSHSSTRTNLKHLRRKLHFRTSSIFYIFIYNVMYFDILYSGVTRISYCVAP